MTDEEARVSKELSRRAFLKKMAVVGFAVPVVTSFALDGVTSASPKGGNVWHLFPYEPVLTFPNSNHSTGPNQFLYTYDEFLSSFYANQSFPI
jgi:hypothetical protein